MEKDKRLPGRLIDIVESAENPVFLSVASIWEMVIKKGKNRLKVPKNIARDVATAGFAIISIDISHVLGVQDLPLHHNDPFDRILISQSKIEDLTLVTGDKKISDYNIDILKF